MVGVATLVVLALRQSIKCPGRFPKLIDPPIEPLDHEGIMSIHNGAMQNLEEIGIEFLNPEALKIMKMLDVP